MNNLQESILDAMKVFVKDSTAKLNFPLTLECEIIKCTDEDKGEYEVNYLDNHFLAYRQYKGYKYNEGEVAYVLIPKGDFSKTKIILGIEKDGLIDSIVPVGSFVEDVKVDGVSVVTDSIANIDNMATKNDISTLQTNFQAGVDAIGAACTRKGSPPASHSLEDTVAAIDAITTGGNYATLEVREDGTYRADEDPRGLDAYDIVVVSKDVGQPHTVVFYGPDGSIIQTQANVPYHGYASCTLLDGTTYLGQYFKGWNPHPTNVVEDMFCYPQYGDYVIDPGETHDSWETICADGGAHYPLGTYKALIINVPSGSNIPFELKHIYYRGNYFDSGTRNYNFNGLSVALEMVKVAEGEDGSTSTWLSTGAINFGSLGVCSSYNLNVNTWADSFSVSIGWNNANCDWGNVFLRKYLNEYLLDALPMPIKTNVKEVTKYYSSWNVSPSIYYWGGTRLQKSSLDKIWVPSMKELHTLFAAAPNYSDYSGTEEFEGIDYSSVYLPSYGKFAVRSCNLGANYINPLFLDGTITPIDQGCGRFPFGFCL